MLSLQPRLHLLLHAPRPLSAWRERAWRARRYLLLQRAHALLLQLGEPLVLQALLC
jgi:hypothetical protein